MGGTVTPYLAIDCGSNSFKVVAARVKGNGNLEILETRREKVRLGQFAFTDDQLIPQDYIEGEVIPAFQNFQAMALRNQVAMQNTKAVGTSALRDAKNGEALVEAVEKATGIHIDIIDSDEEGDLVFRAVKATLPQRKALIIDIGGGSVELILTKKGEIARVDSLELGAVRLLQLFKEKADNQVELAALIGTHARRFNKRIVEFKGRKEIEVCIATGGNSNALRDIEAQQMGKKSAARMTLVKLNRIALMLQGLSVRERMEQFQFKSDRSDVIFPAALILRYIMQAVACTDLVIPNVGLKEGLIYKIHEEAEVSEESKAVA